MKSTVDELALFGGAPLCPNKLYIGRPNTAPASHIHHRIDEAIGRQWLTNDGPLVRELELRCADFLNVPHCIAVNNATIGLQIVAKALGLHGEVLLPSFTFIGTAHALQWIGLKPVFCDVLPHNHLIDPAEVARRLTKNTSAILGVHVWGHACDIEALTHVAQEHELALFFDAAHAFGCSYQNKMIASFGQAEVFSLHATKVMHSLEGGLITTTDANLAEKFRLLRNYGFTGEDAVGGPGINAKMNEFCAAVGLSNLDYYPTVSAHNAEIMRAYRHALGDIAGIRLLEPLKAEAFNHHYAVLELSENCPLRRNLLRDILVAEGVLVRRYFHPGCHRLAPYNDLQSDVLPVTDFLSQSLLQLPTGTQLTIEQAKQIGELIAICIKNAAAISEKARKPYPPPVLFSKDTL